MKTDEVNKILHTLLCDTYDMENQIRNALPKMEKAANDPRLAQGFAAHTEETDRQIERLERVHKILNLDIKDVTCEVTSAMIEEGETLFKGCEEGPVRDAALIVAAQKIEHLEIASYGSMIALARSLGHNEAASLLEESLEEEKSTDEKLTMLATTGHINEEAVREAA